MTEGISNPEKSRPAPRVTRRWLLERGAAAVGAAAGGELALRIPDFTYAWLKDRIRENTFKRWEKIPLAERADAFEKVAKEFQEFVRSSEGTRILESGTDQELFDFLRAIPAIDQEVLRGTRLDFPLDKWPSVAFSSKQLTVPTTAKDAQRLKESTYGNAVLIAKNTLLTNWHVLKNHLQNAESEPHPNAERERIEKIYRDSGYYDAALVTVTDPDAFKSLIEAGAQIFPLSRKSNAELQGSSVCVPSIDKDPNSRADGTKIRHSAAIQATAHLARFIIKYSDYPIDDEDGIKYRVKRLVGKYLTIGNPGGEIKGVDESRTGSRVVDSLLRDGLPKMNQVFDKNTSGSPALQNGEVVGTHYSGDLVKFKQNYPPLEISFFVGGPDIRAATERGQRYTTNKLPVTPSGDEFFDYESLSEERLDEQR